MLKILSFGITMSVSTDAFIRSSPSSACWNLLFPSKLNGFVTTHTVKIPISLAISAITGAAHVPVPHPIPAVMKTISVSSSMALISSYDSSADFFPTSGFAHAQRPLVSPRPMLICLSACDHASDCASVFTAINSTQSSPSVTIRFRVFDHAHPTQITLIFAPGIISGVNSCIAIVVVCGV